MWTSWCMYGIVIVAWLCATVLYARREQIKRIDFYLWIITGAVVVVHILFAVYLSWAQYHIWQQDPFSKQLLSQALSPHTGGEWFVKYLADTFSIKSEYFLGYVFGRFWMNVFLGVGVAFIFYGALRALKKYKERFFDKGEVVLGLLGAMVVGWPWVLGYVICALFFVVILSLMRHVAYREIYTTLGVPLIVSGYITLALYGLVANIF